MSLLLEALKKAEKAKEEAQRKGARQDTAAQSAARTELSCKSGSQDDARRARKRRPEQ